MKPVRRGVAKRRVGWGRARKREPVACCAVLVCRARPHPTSAGLRPAAPSNRLYPAFLSVRVRRVRVGALMLQIHRFARYQSSVRGNSLFQPYPWRVPDFLPRAGDIERAALRIEVHPAPVERRLDAERRAQQLHTRRQRSRPATPADAHGAASFRQPTQSERPARSASSLPRRPECMSGRRRRDARRTAGSPPPDRRCR